MEKNFFKNYTTNPENPEDPIGIHTYYQNIIFNMPNNVYWLDRNGITQGCNENTLKFIGLKKPEDFLGITYEQMGKLAGWEDWKTLSFKNDDIEVISTGKPKISVEEPPFLDKDGNIIHYISTRVPLFDKNKNVIGVLGISVDITDQKKKEEIASKTKTEFLENMRHDIRTPLSGIVGFADLLRSEITDPKMKKHASDLAVSCQALKDLLDKVLEVVKVSSGEIPILKKKFSLKKKLTEIISLNQARASYKKIDLILDYDSAIPNYLIGDSARIYRVVLELVTNALNFTHKGRVKLSAQLAKDNEENVLVKIIVEDTGIGMEPEKQQDIYLQFKRLTPSYEGVYKGHGLGLYIAKQLIDDLKAEIYVESQVGDGSKFIFIMKLKKPFIDEELGSEDLIPSFTGNPFIPPMEFKAFVAATYETSQSYKSHILVVEDSPIAAAAVTAMLSKIDCIVDLAKEGKEAVDLAEKKKYDVIFMDIGLPDIDGYEVTKRIRLHEFKKNSHHVPILALTAHTSEENKRYCIDIGMNAVLTKPLRQEKAENILNSFIPCRKDR